MTPRIVGVIFSRADLRRALRVRKAPDLFELRLDALVDCVDEVWRAVARLRAPLIITARHPQEGGENDLSAAQRRRLLLDFLSCAQFVDVELRSAGSLGAVLEQARAKRVRIIISHHDFAQMPSPEYLRRIAASANSLGADFVKIAARTDSAADLAALLDFFRAQSRETKIVAMGIGRFGRASRRELMRLGCLLSYGHLGSRAVEGQLSVGELRRLAAGRDAVS